MGYAIAEEAANLGAEVTLISGPTNLTPPANVHFVPVISSEEMFLATQKVASEQDIMIMAAAVSDYTPAEVATQKIKKKSDNMAIELKKTTDILKSVGQNKRPDQVLVGFALETEHEKDNAKKKLLGKNLDFIVLNSLRDKGAGFSHDTNKVTIMDREGSVHDFPLKSKQLVAKDILDKVISLLEKTIKTHETSL